MKNITVLFKDIYNVFKIKKHVNYGHCYSHFKYRLETKFCN